MTHTSSSKSFLNRFTVLVVALPFLSLASGCAVGGLDPSDGVSEPVAVGGQTSDETGTPSGGTSANEPATGDLPSGGAATGGASTGGATNAPSTGGSGVDGNAAGGNDASDAPSDDAVTVQDANLIGKTFEGFGQNLTIERAETTTRLETNPIGEPYVSHLHSITVKVETPDNGTALRESSWELALADGMLVGPLCAPEPAAPGIVHFRFDFFYDSEQALAGAWLERSVARDEMPVTVALSSFVSAEEPSSED